MTSFTALAQNTPPGGDSPKDLASLDLAALMNLEVTSVSRRSERLSDAAASVFVITADDIRRSGATNLPDALRLAPALDVVMVSANSYTVSARGFINSSSNKLLVLIDGRSVYTPLFSGVFWDVQDVVLEDIDRIEVISGPGGTLWGVNAVNGIINIITRAANETQGGLLAAGGGTLGTIGTARYGGEAGADAHYRVYGKYVGFTNTETAGGVEKDDAGHRGMAGFRGDWAHGRDQFTLLGNAYKGSQGQPEPGSISISGITLALDDVELQGVNLTGNWKRTFADGSSINVQGYFDRTERVVPPTFSERLNVYDLQFIHSLRAGRVHQFAWGAEYRASADHVTNSPYVAFLPANLNQKWAAIFAQDEMAIAKDVRLTVGLRSERNDYTGNEFLPNVRLGWTVAPSHLVWAAASRTVRAPSRLDTDIFVPGGPPFILRGGPDVVSEIANTFELGYRGQPASALTLSVTAFHSLYDHLRTQEVDPSRTFIVFANEMTGRTTGIELWASYQATERWRLSGGFNGISEHFELEPGSNDLAGLLGQAGRDPRRSWRLRSSLDLPRRSEFDVTARRVSERTAPAVPAYSAVDVRFAWQPRAGTEISLTGQNLLGGGHGEFTEVLTRTEAGRGVFLNFVTRFHRGS